MSTKLIFGIDPDALSKWVCDYMAEHDCDDETAIEAYLDEAEA